MTNKLQRLNAVLHFSPLPFPGAHAFLNNDNFVFYTSTRHSAQLLLNLIREMSGIVVDQKEKLIVMSGFYKYSLLSLFLLWVTKQPDKE